MSLAKTIMIQGTASHVGKTLVTAALCAWLRRHGLRVAPFKALNMSLNSAVTADGLEISRSVAVQAAAAGVQPTVQMNPILLKPTSGRGSQVIAMGKAIGYREAASRENFVEWAMPLIASALGGLREQYDVVVLEGAGSSAEVNLRETDVANMRAAEAGDAPVLLVGDIDRGGVFAALYGTVALLPDEHRDRVKGIIVNKFRGERALFQSGVDAIEQLCRTPVLGVLPFLHDLAIPEEDAVALDSFPRHVLTPINGMAERPSAKRPTRTKKMHCGKHREGLSGRSEGTQSDVAVIHLPHISNFTDFDALAADADIAVRYVRRAADWGSPDLVIVPGTKSTVADLAWLREHGLADLILRHAANGGRVIGLCGGYQILGRRIHDAQGVEASAGSTVDALGLLDVETVFGDGKIVRHARGVGVGGWMDGVNVEGYEIHHGESTLGADAQPLLALSDEQSPDIARFDGAVDGSGRIAGAYLHGLFDTLDARLALRSFLGLQNAPSEQDQSNMRVDPFGRLADWFEENVDTERVMHIIMGEQGQRLMVSENDQVLADTPNNRSICPVCGRNNGCTFGKESLRALRPSIALTPSGTECWCTGIAVSREKMEVTFGPFAMDKTCLCRNCLEQFLE